MSFTLDDLTQELFGRVVLLEQHRSSGLGGAGAVLMITKMGEEYLLGMDGFEYSEFEIDKYIPLLAKEDKIDPIHYRSCYLVEDKGWKYVRGNVLIREDYYEKISLDYEKRKEREIYVSWTEVAKKILDPENIIPRNVYVGTEAFLKKREEERKAEEQCKALVRLTEDDLDWKDLYINNQKFNGGWLEGTYLLLFKKNEDGSISGSKWTIQFQREEFEPCGHKANAPIDAYNLYYKSYENMVGLLQYCEPNENGDSCYEYSTLQDGVNDYGKFVRSYKALESAKQGALHRNECGWGNYYKDNLIRINWSKIDIAEVEKDYREKILKKESHEKKLQLLFAEKYTVIYTALAEHDSPGNAIYDIAEKLHITREEVIKMWEFFMPTLFCKKGLDEARRIVEKKKKK